MISVVALVALVDLREAIVGEIPSWEDRLKPESRGRKDGSWLVDGRFDMAQLGADIQTATKGRVDGGVSRTGA